MARVRVTRPHGLTRCAARLASGSLLLLLSCTGGGQREPLRLPPVDSLRSAAEPMLVHVEQSDDAPAWLDQQRVENGVIYGVGIHRGKGRADRDLYEAMRAARGSVASYLVSRGGLAMTPRELFPPLRVDENAIEFERLAHDRKRNRWYALARLDITSETTKLMKGVNSLNYALSTGRAAVLDDTAENDNRVRAALAIIYALDRRQQYAARYHALTGKGIPASEGLDDSTLQELADDLLDAHGVRIVVYGLDVPGLHDRVSGVLGAVHLRTDEFGPGAVTITLSESDTFDKGYPYLQLDGHIELAIEGGDARTYSEPIHIVSSGVDVSEARSRADRSLNREVSDIVRRTLLKLAETGG